MLGEALGPSDITLGDALGMSLSCADGEFDTEGDREGNWVGHSPHVNGQLCLPFGDLEHLFSVFTAKKPEHVLYPLPYMNDSLLSIQRQ